MSSQGQSQAGVAGINENEGRAFAKEIELPIELYPNATGLAEYRQTSDS